MNSKISEIGRKVADFIWPSLESLESQREGELIHLAELRQANFSRNSDVALQEARNIFNREQDRFVAAQSRASVYLGVVTGTIPILFSLLTNFFLHDFGKNPAYFQILILVLFFAGLAYLFRAAFWTFDALRVGAVTRVDAPDIARIWKKYDPPAELARELLMAARLNWTPTNRRVSKIMMAHAFAIRAIILFLALLVSIMVLRPLFGTLLLEYHLWVPTSVMTV